MFKFCKYASRNGKSASLPTLQVGDMVYVKSDRSKSKARDSFFILGLDEPNKMATIQKFPMTNFRHHPINVQYQNLYPCSPIPLAHSGTSQHLPVLSQPPAKSPSRSRQSPISILSNPPIYTPLESDSDSEEECVHHVLPLHVFPTPPHDPPHEPPVADGDADPVDDIPLHAPQDVDNQPPPIRLQLFQPLYGQKDYLKVGDMVALVQGDSWCKVVLISHSGHKDALQDSLYWNYSALDGSNPTGSYLFPGQAWGVLRGDLSHVDLSVMDIIMPPTTTVAAEASVDSDDDETPDAENKQAGESDRDINNDVLDVDTTDEPD